MKQILFLFASIIAMGSTANAITNSNHEFAATSTNHKRGYNYNNSFIFVEEGIEFSVFADGQFDFYLPSHGPSFNADVYSSDIRLSFNTGYNYNPYVQYDGYGAIIQIENTPIFYDYYGRVNQIGNIGIYYNRFGRIMRIGNLSVYYRNSRFHHYSGYINSYNRRYVWRPWHRYYSAPSVNFCQVSVNPYRQYYRPTRHVYYRPYTNNTRHFNRNDRGGRRGATANGRRNTLNKSNNRYAQKPRTNKERKVKERITRRNSGIRNSRVERMRTIDKDKKQKTRVNNSPIRTESNTRVRNSTQRQTRNTGNNTRATSRNNRNDLGTHVSKKRKNNVTRNRKTVSNRIGSINKPRTRKQSTVNNKRKQLPSQGVKRTSSRTKSTSLKQRRRQ